MTVRTARRAFTTASALAVGLVLAACASTSSGGSAFDEDDEVLIEVSNRNVNRVVIQALSTGRERRLGEVETNGTRTFTLPQTMSALDLRLRIDPIGPSGSFITPEIPAGPGDRIIVTVEPNISLTRVTVR